MRAINLFSFFSSLLFFLSLHPWKRNLTFDIFNLKWIGKLLKKFYFFNFVDFLNIRRIFICLEKGKKESQIIRIKENEFLFSTVWVNLIF